MSAPEDFRIYVSGKLAKALTAEAKRREVRPAVLAGALMRIVLEGDLVDSILDGDDPNAVAPGHGRTIRGLTRLHCGVLYMLALNADADQVAAMPLAKLADLLSAGHPSSISYALAVLCRNGLLERVERKGFSGGRALQPYRLTDAGWQMARALGGSGFEPDGGAA